MISIAFSTSAESGKKGSNSTKPYSVTVKGPGVVYLYGELLPGPTYTFTNIGGDTLFLNGIPRYPLKKISRFTRLPKEEQVRKLAQAERSHAADTERYNTLKAMHDAGATKAELLEYLANVCRTVPGITRVTIFDHSVVGYYADGGIREFGLPSFEAQPEKTDEDLRAFHEHLIELFRNSVEAGGLAAYGVARDSLTYQLHGPKASVQLMEQRGLLAKLAAGEVLTKDDVRDTPLSNEGFRIDMADRLRKGVAKEGGSQ
jgi:hypothetical protein